MDVELIFIGFSFRKLLSPETRRRLTENLSGNSLNEITFLTKLIKGVLDTKLEKAATRKINKKTSQLELKSQFGKFAILSTRAYMRSAEIRAKLVEKSRKVIKINKLHIVRDDITSEKGEIGSSRRGKNVKP
ncbi:hypothetical protein WA026_016557 [Henosepilachna vigintioctopunctata]|uniref:Uncharacterized protein n=1 Tax=Henosepilachna vigintioctopunctata TaxID=420089 RepID=A0AAW1VEK6_9CUCU